MRPGLPPANTAGRILLLHPEHGFMVGEMLVFADGARLCAIGIDTSPQRNPIMLSFLLTDDASGLEWISLDVTNNPGERVRAMSIDARRKAEESAAAPPADVPVDTAPEYGE
jgi:hypothetical protein